MACGQSCCHAATARPGTGLYHLTLATAEDDGACHVVVITGTQQTDRGVPDQERTRHDHLLVPGADQRSFGDAGGRFSGAGHGRRTRTGDGLGHFSASSSAPAVPLTLKQ